MKRIDPFVVSLLKGIHLFADLDNPALVDLADFFKERIYDDREVIFEEGAMGDSMMVIASGEVRVTQKASAESEEALCVLKRGDFFGEMALLEALPRTAAAIAHTNAITLEIKREDFIQYVNNHSEAGVKILLKLCQTLSARLREANTKLKTFVSLSQWL